MNIATIILLSLAIFLEAADRAPVMEMGKRETMRPRE
jgi:hypothetical protein